MDAIKQLALQPLARLISMVRRHPRRLPPALTAVLGGFAVTAFGIAPLAPDAADLPQRMVAETVALPGLEQQAEELAFHDLQLWRSDTTRASDTADTLLRRLGVADPAAAAYIRGDTVARRLIEGRPGKMVQALALADGTLLEIVARYPASESSKQSTHFTRLTLTRAEGQFTSRIETAALQVQVRLGSGAIRSSLFAATDESGLPDSIAAQIADIFSADIDFHRELRKGDRFSVVFEALTADDQPITWNEGTGRVLAAEFVQGRGTSTAVWFNDPATGKGAYFDVAGRSKRGSFLASPLAFSRVSSGFAMRLHPILQTWRAHNGIDYAAPKGTPVRSVGDGIVEKAGWQNGYGNVVSLKHAGNKSTVYAHLSAIDVRNGQRVAQGQTIGAVGATGWATGPHLHFEFRIGGDFQDPRQIARQTEAVTMDARSSVRFQALASTAQARLVAADSMRGYRGDSE